MLSANIINQKKFLMISEKPYQKNQMCKRDIYDIIEANLIYKNNFIKIFEKEFESQVNDYRDEDVEKKENFFKGNLGQLPIHQLIKQIKIDELMWDCDAVNLVPSRKWDENIIYPRIGTGYAYTKDMNDELVHKFNHGNLTKGSALLKIKCYNPKILIVQHRPVK